MSNPYVLVAAGVLWLSSLVSSFFYGQHTEAQAWRLKLADQKTQATAELLDLRTQLAARQHAIDELMTKTEHDHAQNQAALDRRGADLDRLAADLDRLRAQPRRGSGCDRQLPATAGPAADPAAAPAYHTGGAPGSFRELAELARLCRDTAEYARVGHQWAVSIPTTQE